MKKYKIYLYIPSLSIGGAEKVTIFIAQYFQENGAEVSIITNYINDLEYELPFDIKRISLIDKSEKISKIKIIKRIKKIINDQSPDLLIAMGTPLSLYATSAVKKTNTKLIISERNSPENFSGKKITQLVSNRSLSKANGYIFQTKGAANYYDWVEGKKAIIPNPLFVHNIPESFKRKKEKAIVNIGRLHPQKNQKLLINAFSLIEKKYQEYNLVIYGEGPERENLESQIKELNLTERVFLPGSTPEVLDKIKKASIFAFSSDFEGMPNALIEAMALGLPVVSTDCPSGGPKELIENGVNGLLTPVGNKEKLAENLDYLLSNPSIANELGNEAVRVREKLNADKIGKEWLDFSLKILNEQ